MYASQHLKLSIPFPMSHDNKSIHEIILIKKETLVNLIEAQYHTTVMKTIKMHRNQKLNEQE